LAGNLNDDGARRLDQEWRTASSAIGDRRLIVDITFVTGADEQGRALAESILGEPLPKSSAAAPDRTWLPFRTHLLHPR
jgi:hypothetical protein